MIAEKLSTIAKILNAELIGASISVLGISIDTRTLAPQNLFFAIKGPHHDGHDFVAKAALQGASAVVVDRKLSTSLPQLLVKDTRVALGDLARYYRTQFTIPFVALTGSCGKTTTKMLIAAILRAVGSVHHTVGNLNNDYGVPLTLLAIPPKTDYAVIEMGANHPQEIFYLTQIVKPSIALITNVGPVHLEGFKTLEGVAKAKGEIFEGLVDDGIALINMDDPYVSYWMSAYAGRRFMTFGQQSSADVYAKNVCELDEGGSMFELCTLQGNIQILLPLLGDHNVYNALAAATVGLAVGISLPHIKQGLESCAPVSGRFVEKRGKQGAIIIDDTYNSNPLAMEKALAFLSGRQGKRLLVMGDMGELGEASHFYHVQIGTKAKEYGVDALYALGEYTQDTVKSFGSRGFHFLTHEEMITALLSELKENMTILVKGSRMAKMEKIVEALVL